MLTLIYIIICFFMFRYISKVSDSDIKPKLYVCFTLQSIIYLITIILVNLMYFIFNYISL